VRLLDPYGVPVAAADLGEPGTPAYDQLCEWSARYAGTGPDLRPVLTAERLGDHLREVTVSARRPG